MSIPAVKKKLNFKLGIYFILNNFQDPFDGLTRIVDLKSIHY